MAIKADMDKAYDRIEWIFVIKVLQQFGFHGKWLRWVEQCISTPRSPYRSMEALLRIFSHQEEFGEVPAFIDSFYFVFRSSYEASIDSRATGQVAWYSS